MPFVRELDSLLESEQVLGNQLIALIEQEKTLLESRRFDELPPLLESKSNLLEQLDQAYQARESWCTANGLESRLEQAPPQLPDATISRMKACKETYNNIRYYNELNGILIANSRKRARLQLEVMRGLGSSDRVYDASGATAPTSSQHNLSRA